MINKYSPSTCIQFCNDTWSVELRTQTLKQSKSLAHVSVTYCHLHGCILTALSLHVSNSCWSNSLAVHTLLSLPQYKVTHYFLRSWRQSSSALQEGNQQHHYQALEICGNDTVRATLFPRKKCCRKVANCRRRSPTTSLNWTSRRPSSPWLSPVSLTVSKRAQNVASLRPLILI